MNIRTRCKHLLKIGLMVLLPLMICMAAGRYGYNNVSVMSDQRFAMPFDEAIVAAREWIEMLHALAPAEAELAAARRWPSCWEPWP